MLKRIIAILLVAASCGLGPVRAEDAAGLYKGETARVRRVQLDGVTGRLLRGLAEAGGRPSE